MTSGPPVHCPVCDAPASRKIPARIADFVRARAGLPASAEAASWFCGACWHVFFTPMLTDEQISRLYHDYRGPSYNEQRLRYEADYVTHQNEFENRDSNHHRVRREFYDAFLGEYYDRRARVVDYGGPDAFFGQYVFPAGEVAWASRLTGLEPRSSLDGALAEADVLFVALVLQSCPRPRQVLQRLTGRLRPGSLVWIELPVEYKGSLRANWEFLQERGDGVATNFGPLQTLHEHVGHFSQRSAVTLARLSGVTVDMVVQSNVGIMGVLGRRDA